MLINNFIYKVKGKEYPVVITYKRIKNIIMRFKDDTFYVSAPRLTLKISIVNALNKHALKMINKRGGVDHKVGFTDEHIYLFGHKVAINKNGGEINFSNGEVIKYKSLDDLERKLKKFFLPLITQRVRYYEQQMCVPSYKVTVKKMSSRLGSNSRKTNSLHFAFNLIHYRFEVIDSVVVHELAHIVHFDHSKNFYNVVYKYCPNYKKYTKIIKEYRFDE